MTMIMCVCIIMNMNIYISQGNEKRLRALSDKTMSGLVNELLEKYFGGELKTENIKENPDGTISAEDPSKPSSFVSGVIKTSQQAKEAALKKVGEATDTVKKQPGLCPIHGSPLDSRGKCLQKGCKYS